jgi:hypothetical protein
MTTDNFVFICKAKLSKLFKQEVNGAVILSHLGFPGLILNTQYEHFNTVMLNVVMVSDIKLIAVMVTQISHKK